MSAHNKDKTLFPPSFNALRRMVFALVITQIVFPFSFLGRMGRMLALSATGLAVISLVIALLLLYDQGAHDVRTEDPAIWKSAIAFLVAEICEMTAYLSGGKEPLYQIAVLAGFAAIICFLRQAIWAVKPTTLSHSRHH